ncbi:unnamed protein product [Lampetra planeri]
MEQTTLDSLALERLLSLAQELGVSFPVLEEDDLSSLKVARCNQAHVNMQHGPGWLPVQGSWRMRRSLCRGSRSGPVRRSSKVHARGKSRGDNPRGPLPAWRSMIASFKCGQPGHIVRGCRNSTGSPSSPSTSSAPPTSVSSAPQASHDASDTRPQMSHHASPLLSAFGSHIVIPHHVTRIMLWRLGCPQ